MIIYGRAPPRTLQLRPPSKGPSKAVFIEGGISRLDISVEKRYGSTKRRMDT